MPIGCRELRFVCAAMASLSGVVRPGMNALRYDKKASSPLRNSPNHGQPWNTEQEQESYSFTICASNDQS